MTADRVEESYRRLHPRLWHALLAWCGDRELASDAEAEAFTQALRRGDSIVDVDGWVWRSAFRIAAGLLAESHPEELSVFDQVAAPGPNDSVVELLSILDDLSSQQRAVVALRYIGDFRPTEIAEVLGTTSGSVRVQLHRAHNHLRAALEKSS